MKVFVKLFAFVLAVATVFAFSACDKKENTVKQYGYAYEIEEETLSDDNGDALKDEKGNDKKALIIKGLYVGQDTQNEFDAGFGKSIELEISDSGDFNIYNEANGDNQFDENGNVLDPKNNLGHFENYAEIRIAADAFSGQKILKSVKLGGKVTEIGANAFAGCSGLTTMTVPFVGTKAKAYNVNKSFASLFGTAEVTGCTSTTVTYNEGNTATYYLPSGLTEVVVNYSENTELPEYSFAGITVLKKVTLNNVTEIGSNAFAGCTGLTTVKLDAAKLTVIGKAAFSGCTSLYNFDLASLTKLETVYQEAFSGCSKLGLGYEKITLPAATYMEKAFKDCTSLKAIDLMNVKGLGECCFYGCSSLETVKNLNDGIVNGTLVFQGTKYQKNPNPDKE